VSSKSNVRCEAVVSEFLYNHHDDIDGWKLSDGHLIHFPPHVGVALCEWIGIGDNVYVEGHHKTLRDERKIVNANYVESQGWKLDWRDDANKHGKHAVNQTDHVLSQILIELTAIRQLLESGKTS